jgi:hypothetical protein
MQTPHPRFSTRLPAPVVAAPIVVFVVAFLLQLPLALAPGYFSHDELQWAWRAGTVDFVPWWDDRTTFQFRPLTFNLWMVLSRAFFETPWAFHSVLVAWGAANAALLCAVGRRFGMSRGTAAVGALLFVLTPYAAYTHGWVATIADFIWVSCALVLAWCVLRFEQRLWIAAVAFAITGVALFGKEAAAAIPVLCAAAWALDPPRRGRWTAALMGSGLAVAMFVAWRLPALLNAPRDGGTQYVPSLWNVPLRWLEYQVFLPMVPGLEAHTVWQRPAIAVVCGVVWAALLVALWKTRRSVAAVFVLGGVAALAPVLLLGGSASHYGYGFAAVVALSVAAAWPLAKRPARAAIAAFAVLMVLHGVSVMLQMHAVARVQSVFSPQLAEVMAAHAGPAPVRLLPAKDAKPWIFLRLTHQIPEYRGVPIGDRVQLVESGDADYRIEADGRLTAIRTSPRSQ